MTLDELFNGIREHYVDAFSASVKDKVNDPEAWLIEHTFGPQEEPDESDEPDDTGLDLPMRHDVIPLKDGQPEAVMVIRTETEVNFKPFKTRWKDTPLTVTPFTWDRCQFAIEGFDDDTDWQPLIDWFNAWFDPEDQKEPDENGVRNVIHTVFPPQTDESGEHMLLEVDLGTAEVDALPALWDALVEMGATSFTIGSELFGDEDDEEDEDSGEGEDEGGER